jgi:Bifunctional DNA primase/polymerase, N-terminal/Primase C terminal 1 (PriCT-1)
VVRSALRLAEKGLAVIPCMPADKRPACRHGVREATTDPAIIAEWWGYNPRYNIGIATGAISGVFVTDIDNKDDVNGEAELRKLEAVHGPLPATVEIITGGNGRQLYYKYPGTAVRNSVGAIAPGIDIRGDGGFVVAPPSIHPNGRRYAWSIDSANALAAAPQWLIDAVTARPNGNAVTLPASQWRDMLDGQIRDGTRNDTLTRITGHLLARHVDPIVVLAIVQSLNLTRCAPPLPAQDVETIVASICARELRKRDGRAG